MPIRAENRKRYPKNWKQIRETVLERAGHCCEGSPLHPWCRARNRCTHPETGAVVVLTIAHLAPPIENCSFDNLRAWCQRCHNEYDAKARAAGIRERRMQRAGQLALEEA